MVYTSGTTGAPKAVMLSHANLLFIGNNNRRLRKLGPGDTVYGVLPLSHVYGLSALLVASLISGAALVLVPRFSERRWRMRWQCGASPSCMARRRCMQSSWPGASRPGSPCRRRICG